MKRKFSFIFFLLTMLMIINLSCMTIVKAADEYTFELNYTGDIVINDEKEATVVLRGTDATPHSKVRIKVEVNGPATPKIMATDSSGVEHDIAQIGYWGPDTGFEVGGTFENKTPIKATFSAAGTYTIKLSLINLENNNDVITSKTETIEVLEDKSNVSNDVNDVTNNVIDKLPQTGTSVTEYIAYAGIIIAVVIFGYYKISKVKA